MKIRSGFVSNSSSASFILLVDLNKEDFLSLFKEGFCRYENIVLGYKGILTEMVEKDSKYMEKYKDKEDLKGYEKILYNSYKESLKDLEEVEKINLDTVSEETEWIYLKKILELESVFINPVFSDKVWKIEGWTNMFNDYTDVPQFMQQFITLCVFKGISIKAEVRED